METISKQPISEYHVASRNKVRLAYYVEQAKMMKDMYKWQYTMASEHNTLEHRTILSLIGAMVVWVVNEFIVEIGMVTNNWVMMVYFGWCVIYVCRNMEKMRREKKDFEEVVQRNVVDEGYPTFMVTTHIWSNIDKIVFYEGRERVLNIVKEEVGDCLVFELDTPLIKQANLPEGLILEDKLVFEKGNQRFQVAYEEDVDVGNGSYMILYVEEDPIPLLNTTVKQYI